MQATMPSEKEVKCVSFQALMTGENEYILLGQTILLKVKTDIHSSLIVCNRNNLLII